MKIKTTPIKNEIIVKCIYRKKYKKSQKFWETMTGELVSFRVQRWHGQSPGNLIKGIVSSCIRTKLGECKSDNALLVVIERADGDQYGFDLSTIYRLRKHSISQRVLWSIQNEK